VTAADLAQFAITALARHRLRTGLSLLGVAIGVAAIVTLTALGEGARRYVTSQFTSLGSNLVIVLPGRNETTGMSPVMGGVPNDLTLEDARALQLYRSINMPERAAHCLARLGSLQDALVELHRHGRLDEACELLKTYPEFRIQGWAKQLPYKNPEYLERELSMLRKAGLPE